MENNNDKQYGLKSHYYQVAVTAAGIVVWLAAAANVVVTYAPKNLLMLAAVLPFSTVVGFFPITFPLPTGRKASNEKIDFTLVDAFVLTAAVCYGIAPAILIAGLEGFTSSRRLVRRTSSNLFSSSMMSLTAAAAAGSLSLILHTGWTGLLANGSRSFSTVALALLIASIIQVSVNWSFISALFALRQRSSFSHLWKENFLCAAPMFLPTGVLASMMYFALQFGATALLAIGGPVFLSIYFGHHQYRTKAEESEKAERDRAEAERARAEQAESHVLELNNYIAEQERISRILEETKEHFRHAAFHDSLTGLPNRAMFVELLKAEIENARLRPGHLFAVLYLDLDRFKNINDSLGHTHGDLLLVAFAQRLEALLRPADALARFGGDEFAVLLSDITNAEAAIGIAERIQKDLERPFELDKSSSFTTASIGIAISSTGYEGPDDLLRDADTAMYRAKETGKARCEMFDQAMHARAISRLRLESDLRQAIERNEFCVHYQPIITLESGRIAGFEALVRWEHPERGRVSPGEFIPLAEETGLIVQIGQSVLDQACRKIVEWQRLSASYRSLSLSVNISSRQVSQPDLIDRIKEVIEDTGIDPRCLKLEITETVVMENAEAATAMFKQLRALGVQLSIDDFGTGYSSLSYLHRFPVNYLKIDQSFVGMMTERNHNAEIVRTIITLARNLGLEVIAEGIETEHQHKQLKALGCGYGQGYLFSRPVDSAAVRTLLTKSIEPEPTVEFAIVSSMAV
jgi:diguanylate cyclase (GGDEF)-like protein